MAQEYRRCGIPPNLTGRAEIERHRQDDLRPLMHDLLDSQLAPKLLRPRTHVVDASASREPRPRGAYPVIVDAQDHVPSGLPQRQVHPARPRVLDNVSERLLGYPQNL